MAPDPLTPYGNRPMVTPIVNAVNYEYISFEVLRQITDGEIDGYTYHRDDNPTVREVERRIAELEGAEDGVVCTTGMAACTMVYLTYCRVQLGSIVFVWRTHCGMPRSGPVPFGVLHGCHSTCFE